MPFDPHVNGAQTTVAVAPTPPMSGTTIICSSGDGVLFPDPAVVGAYNVSLWPAGTSFRSDIGEIVRVTTHVPTGDSFTVTRHQEGSTARTIAVSWRMAMAPTAKTFTDAEKWNTGTAGGQSVIGGTGASEDLVLSSTTHLTKGKVRIGSGGIVYFDEALQIFIIERNYSGPTGSRSPFYIEEHGTSDPSMEFAVFGSNSWEIGIDNSDDDAFKLNNSTGVADFTEIGIRIDRTGAVLVKGTPGSGADMLQIGQDSPNSYARLRMQGRYHGSSGQGIFDIEALNDQMYIFDRTNGVFLMSWAVGGQVAIAGSLVVSVNVGVSGSLTVTGNIVSNSRIGVGVVPGYGLDVELGVGATYGKFGSSLPVYIIAAQPTLGLNAYYNGGWRYGKGSTAHYGAFIGLTVTSGELDFSFSPAPGAADVVFSATTPFAVTPTNARLPLLPSQPVLGTDASGNIIPGTGGTGGGGVSNSFADVMDHGGVGNGSSDDRAAIAACDALGIGILFRGGHTYRIGSNLTISSAVIFGSGAKLLISSGVTVNLNGSILTAPFEWIFTFSGTGTLVLGSKVNWANAEWFGAGMPGCTDDQAAINLCLGACLAGGVEVRLNSYYATCPTAGIHLFGNHALWSKAGSQCFSTGSQYGIIIEGFTAGFVPRKIFIPSMGTSGGGGFPSAGCLFWGAGYHDVECIGWMQANAIHVEWLTDASHAFCSDNIFRCVFANAGSVVACLASSSGTYLEGNAFFSGFANDFAVAALEFLVLAGPDPQFNGFDWRVPAVDFNSHHNSFGIYTTAAFGVPLCSFDVTSWCGGYARSASAGNNIQMLGGYFASLNMYLANHVELIQDNYHWQAFHGSGDTNHIVVQGKSTLYRTIYAGMSPYQIIEFEGAFGDELFLFVDSTSGPITINLPYAQMTDHRITIVKINGGGGAITLARNPSTGQVIYWPTGAVLATKNHSGHQFGVLVLEAGQVFTGPVSTLDSTGATPTPNWYTVVDT